MKTLLTVTVFVLLSGAFSDQEFLNEDWQIYKEKYSKKYDNVEENSRNLIWKENIKFIQKHNIRYDLGEHTYFLGINEFTDMTNEEFKEKKLQSREPTNRNANPIFMGPLNVVKLPDTVDWRTSGYVTPVKNQGACGSCWAFSTTGSLEGQYFRKNRNLLSFSEQQLVDCSRPYGTFGCGGGWMDDAFKYLANQKIEQEADYPYIAEKQPCKYNASKGITKVFGVVDITSNDENTLEVAVATQGPISVVIDASQPTFKAYRGGIYNDPNCSNDIHDHAVLVVGYGNDNGVHYWLVKNSWGASWGDHGYIKMSKDKKNQCGIAYRASFPVL